VKRYIVVGGEAELALLLHIFPEGVEELDGAFAVYAEEPPIGFDVLETQDVEAGWEDNWRDFHHGVQVGRFWVGPPWETIVVDPGRAFGTGAHPTTRLTLELLQELAPGSLLDIGCGSGVLSIAAAKLGFTVVAALDIDPLAVGAAAENAARNGVALAVARADVLADPLPAAPLWIANLELGLLRRLLQRADLPPLILASGLLAPETVGGGERVVCDGWAAELVRT
jgi:ribosomal protein L11 methyltransferase